MIAQITDKNRKMDTREAIKMAKDQLWNSENAKNDKFIMFWRTVIFALDTILRGEIKIEIDCAEESRAEADNISDAEDYTQKILALIKELREME